MARTASAYPTQKVAVAGLAGAVSIVIVFTLRQFNVETPPEVASAFTVIVTFFAGYLTPPANGEVIEDPVLAPVQPGPNS